MRPLLLAGFILVTLTSPACTATPTAPTPTAALETIGRVTFECWDGICHFFGGAINKGDGCAANVRGVITVRTLDGKIFTSATWALPTARVVPAGDTFGFEGPTTRDTFPEQHATDVVFEWTDVRCP